MKYGGESLPVVEPQQNTLHPLYTCTYHGHTGTGLRTHIRQGGGVLSVYFCLPKAHKIECRMQQLCITNKRWSNTHVYHVTTAVSLRD